MAENAQGGFAPNYKLKGHPVQIVSITDEHDFILNEAKLEEILLSPRVRDKPVVVLSVAGRFRTGKSFLLDLCLRYLSAQDRVDWMGDDSSPLEGFPWKGGSKRITSGILMWSEAFDVTLVNGKKVAVLVVDSQGAFASESTARDCAKVFAISTLISSIQVFNVTSNIGEDDLQHLEFFTEYGRLAMKDDENKPFQTLQFLVRDWSYPYEHSYGQDGGTELLNERLALSSRQSPAQCQLREHIQASFKNIGCFLMPHPGRTVATDPHVNGRLADIDTDFKEQLKFFMPAILAPENLVVKEIYGREVKGRDLVEYFKTYMGIFDGDDLPEPRNVLLATAEANNLVAVRTAFDMYNTKMEEIVGVENSYLEPCEIEQEHIRAMEEVMRIFHETKKMGGDRYSDVYFQDLKQTIDQRFEYFQNCNRRHRDQCSAISRQKKLIAVGVGVIGAMIGLKLK